MQASFYAFPNVPTVAEHAGAVMAPDYTAAMMPLVELEK